MATTRFVLLLILILYIAFCKKAFSRRAAPSTLIQYIRTLSNKAISSEGRCLCERCQDCVCTENGKHHHTDVIWAAIFAEDIYFETIGGNAGKPWPPSKSLDLTKEKGGHPYLGVIDGKHEPLLHLKRYPEAFMLQTNRFFLFDNFERNKSLVIHYNDEKTINALPTYDKIYFVIHGWLETASEDHSVAIVRGLLDYMPLENHGIVIVDWSQGANFNAEICLEDKAVPCTYDRAAANVVLVGRQVGVLTHLLVKLTHVDAHNIHYIGFGLGAQVAHFASHWFQQLHAYYGDSRTGFGSQAIGRLTALDPSARHFQGYPGSHVTESDAHFVDVIHTSSVARGGSSEDTLRGRFGMSISVGSIDIYPNGGQTQPLCTEEKISIMTCSHFSAIGYFISSLDKNMPRNRLLSIPCRSWAEYNSCEKRAASRNYDQVSSMGIEAATFPGHGDHFLHYKEISRGSQPKGNADLNAWVKVNPQGSARETFVERLEGKSWPQASGLLQNRAGSNGTPRAPTTDHFLCGLSAGPPATGRVVRGREAYVGQFPWTVAIVDVRRSPSGQYMRLERATCTGTILTRRWILTAAHCFQFKPINSLFLIIYGVVDLRLQLVLSVNNFVPFRKEADTYFPHEQFIPLRSQDACDQADQDHDVALLRLPSDIIGLPNVFGDPLTVNRACFVIRPPFVAGDEYIFAGFGQEVHPLPAIKTTTLRWYIGKKLSAWECQEHTNLDGLYGAYTSRFCCADNTAYVALGCKGDSGTGLVIYRDWLNLRRAYVIAPLSGGAPCYRNSRDHLRYVRKFDANGNVVGRELRASPDVFFSIEDDMPWIMSLVLRDMW